MVNKDVVLRIWIAIGVAIVAAIVLGHNYVGCFENGKRVACVVIEFKRHDGGAV